MKTRIIIFFALFFLLAKNTFAVPPTGLTVTCTSASCNLSPAGGKLFDEKNLAPGQTITKVITVHNDNTNDDCNLVVAAKNSQDPDKLGDKLSLTIDPYYAQSLTQFFSAGNISLGTVAKSSSKDYFWVVIFDPNTPNEFQEKTATFDFDLNFTCGVPPPSPTGEQTLSSSSVATPPSCDDVAPDVPTNFVAGLGNPGQVTLSWTAPALPYTYFLVAYSDSSSWPPKWGNPNVGSGTSYTVSGLSGGTYWFWLRAGNGCQPGAYVGPTTPVPVSGTTGGGVATGFFPGVLGQQENLNTGAATQAGEIKEVKGEMVCTTCFWWPLLIVQALLILLKRRSLKWSAVVSLFVFLVFLWLNRSCPLSGVCRYFWLFDLGVLLLFFILRKMRRDENS